MQAFVVASLLTGRRACGASVLPTFFVVVEGDVPLPAVEWRREVARPALAERRLPGRETGIKACFWSG